MIKLTRSRSRQGFPRNLHGKGGIELRQMLLATHRQMLRDQQISHEFDQTVWSKAKKFLKEEASNKCAYCEAPTASVTFGDVEHYRPKSRYWWLAYCLDNYLFSCQICNQTHKRDNFPIHGPALSIDPPLPDPFPEALTPTALRELARTLAPDPFDDTSGYPLAKFHEAALNEKPGIIDPYLIDPEPLFKWVPDAVNGEVSIRARSRSAASKRAYDAANRFLGLNREELRRQRYETYEFARILHLSLKAVTVPEVGEVIRQQLFRMMLPESPFAGMVRYFVKDVWKVPLK